MGVIEDVRAIELKSDDDTIAWDQGTPVILHFTGSGQGDWVRVLHADSRQIIAAGGPLTSHLLWRGSTKLFFLRVPLPEGAHKVFALRCGCREAADALGTVLQRVLDGNASFKGQEGEQGGSHFVRKTDGGSAALYFHYYGMLQHQQNMLQDYVRTGTYYGAILNNASDFYGKAVMDVGAGSGILSLFAAQAGAARVYAVEASQMVKFAEQLKNANPALGSRITVLHSKVEELKLTEKVDILVSEPMGTLLLNERMLETYLYARDHFLKPGGLMFPNVGRIHVAAFSDEALHMEIANKAAFWTCPNYYGVDLRVLHSPAMQGYFSQVVVDAFDPAVLVTGMVCREFNFNTVREEELHRVTMPLKLPVGVQGSTWVHGLACWFDVLFQGSNTVATLSTAPGQPTTHWFQLRCVLAEPVRVWPGCMLTGEFRMEAHNRQSYDIFVNITGPPLSQGGPPQQSVGKFDLKEPYYRQLNTWLPPAQAPSDEWGGNNNMVANGSGWPPQQAQW